MTTESTHRSTFRNIIIPVFSASFKVFGLLRTGDGKTVITASFEDKMQTVRLPRMDTIQEVGDFMEILFEELR